MSRLNPSSPGSRKRAERRCESSERCSPATRSDVEDDAEARAHADAHGDRQSRRRLDARMRAQGRRSRRRLHVGRSTPSKLARRRLLDVARARSRLLGARRHRSARMRRGYGGGSAGRVVRRAQPLAKRSGRALRERALVALARIRLQASERRGDGSAACSRANDHAEALDREIRRLCAELSERDLALGILAESARKADVWRRLGFATEVQYARERLGVSLSSLKAKRILASRAARVPELATALSNGRVGYEAAYLLSRVVTPSDGRGMDPSRRATHRKAPERRGGSSGAPDSHGRTREQLPLDEQSLDMLFELERGIVSGDLFGRARDSWAGEGAKSEARGASQMSGAVSPSDDAEREPHGGSQMSGARSAHGSRRGSGA